ncbi:LysR family transcriptional regulator [Radicibacter daui]|uniref:LysR family transcriptional regulator n=1 Tax=Radicibacter daui TaxID=3064829 RepID=UPI0040469326
MMTLRQIEVVRAIMVAGSIAGAARLLNVAQPGVSRTMKHLDSTLGFHLFVRQNGRYVPSPEARRVFDQLQEMHKKLEDLQFSIGQLNRGKDVEWSLASVPSIANVMVPRAIAGLRARYPDLVVDFDIIKLEDAIDYLLLERGELAVMSYRLEHPALTFEPLAIGHLVCICAPDHPLAGLGEVTVAQIAAFPLIGIDPNDPYGGIMAGLFQRAGLSYDISIRARFGTTVCALVKQNLGVAVIDIFTVADRQNSGLAILPIREPTVFQTYVGMRKDAELSSYAETFVRQLRQTMTATLAAGTPGSGAKRGHV